MDPPPQRKINTNYIYSSTDDIIIYFKQRGDPSFDKFKLDHRGRRNTFVIDNFRARGYRYNNFVQISPPLPFSEGSGPSAGANPNVKVPRDNGSTLRRPPLFVYNIYYI